MKRAASKDGEWRSRMSWTALPIKGRLIMQKVADYNIATDGDTSLTPGSARDVALDVNATPDTGSRAILMFNLRIEDPDDTLLEIRVNKGDKEKADFKYTFNSNVTRAMHEVIAAGVLK